jgi:hypothetical protein
MPSTSSYSRVGSGSLFATTSHSFALYSLPNISVLIGKSKLGDSHPWRTAYLSCLSFSYLTYIISKRILYESLLTVSMELRTEERGSRAVGDYIPSAHSPPNIRKPEMMDIRHTYLGYTKNTSSINMKHMLLVESTINQS